MEEPRVRGGSFRMETELRFASSPRRLSLRLRVRTAGFFLPSASFRPLCRPLATCAFVYAFPSVVARISVWSGSGGFVVMTTNPGNPAALSHPLWLSRGSLSIRSPVSLLPACVFITILFYPHRRFSGPFTETFFFLFASPSLSLVLLCSHANSRRSPVASTRAFVHACSRFHTSITCTPRTYVCETLQTAARFIHLLGSVPGCCTPPSPSARVVAPGPTLRAIPEPARAREPRKRGEGG